MKKVFLLLALPLFVHSTSFAQGNSIGAGLSLQFDGGNGSYVNLGDAYNDLQFPFTFEAWISPHSPGTAMGIFASDNDPSVYSGIYISENADNTIQIVFGDGQGSGSQNLQGYFTEQPVSQDAWTHIAIVSHTAYNTEIYINGVDQQTTKTGTANIQQIQHNSGAAYIGSNVTPVGSSFFSGQIDEVRLWNVARTQDHIQTHLCNKLTKIRDGLIGYWTADESFTSTTVDDHSGNNVNGTIFGGVSRVNSGAPIGDISTVLYQNGWKGTKLVLKDSASNDKISISHLRNNPQGVYVYEILSSPYYTTDLDQIPDFYFGVFVVKRTLPPSYNIIYTYNNTDGVITNANKSSAQLFTNTNGSETVWRDFSATNNTNAGTLQVIDAACCGEYILNVPPGPPDRLSSAAASNQLNIFPNPVNDKLFFTLNDRSSLQTIIVSDILGKQLLSQQFIASDLSSGIDVSKLPNGVYFLQVRSDSGRLVREFTIEK